MSGSLRRRAPCQHCGVMCQVNPLEVMLRGGNGWRGHWMWGTVTVCPPCRAGFVDSAGQLQLQEDDDELEQPYVWSGTSYVVRSSSNKELPIASSS